MRELLGVTVLVAGCFRPAVTPVDELPDAPPDARTLTISGTTNGSSGTLPSVNVAAYAVVDETHPVASVLSDVNGNFSLDVPDPFDGFLVGTSAADVSTYVYSPTAFHDDFGGVPMVLFTPTEMSVIYSAGGVTQQADKGVILMLVVDASTRPVAGATVASLPASTYVYSNGHVGPSTASTSTQADGIAWMFNVAAPPTTVSVSAMKPGTTFSSHTLEARSGALTLTWIAP